MKQISKLLLLLLLMSGVGMQGVQVYAQTTDTGADAAYEDDEIPWDAVRIDNLYYMIDEENKTAWVYKCDNSSAREANILEQITLDGESYPVTSIGMEAFNLNHSLQTINIPASVTKIAPDAIRECRGLMKINVDGKNPNFSSADGALMSKDMLTLIDFPCGYTKAYVVPKGIKRIEAEAFYGCQLSAITIPESVAQVGENAFGGCQNLSTVQWNAVRCQGDHPYYGFLPRSVKTLKFGKSVEQIPAYLCKELSELSSVTIPDNVKSIGEHAFYRCSRLSDLLLPNSITEVGDRAFEGVPNVVYNGNLSPEKIGALSVNGYIEGGIVYRDQSKKEVLAGLQSIGKNLVIPNGVERIASRAFFLCSPKRVTIPASVTEVGTEAFGHFLSTVQWNARRVPNYEDQNHVPFTQVEDSFVVGKGVEHIPAYVCFEQPVKKIVINEGVTSVGVYAFGFCKNVKSVTVPASLDSISPAVFSGCLELTKINVSKSNQTYCSVDGVLMSKDKLTLIECPAGLTGKYTIPEGVRVIGAGAFDNCQKLDRVDIAMSVRQIEAYAFSHCESMTSVFIPEGIERMDDNAFKGCERLRSVVWNARRCADFESYDEAPFYQIREQIRTFDFGEEVEHIPAYLCLEMSSLKYMYLPNSAISIGTQAFMSCSKVSEIVIPKRMKLIGAMAFYDCSSLKAVTCTASTPPEMGVLTFEDDNREYGVFGVKGSRGLKMPLTVPANRFGAYQHADQWSDFITMKPITE